MTAKRAMWIGPCVVCLAVTLWRPVYVQTQAREWYVTPAGSATNTGTITSPLSLAKALSSSSPAQPGDTIWLRAGTYTGAYTSVLTGTSSAPITVRGYRGERVTFDGNSAAARSAGVVLAIEGAHVVFRDFEMMSSDAGRTDQNTGYGNFPGAIDINQSQNVKLINLVIHDMPGKGIGAWSENTDAEIYGCLIYYNGMSDHDHGIYVQNQNGTKRIADNIIFDQASHGIHGYGSSDAFLDNITIEGNTVFESGALLNESSRNILLGGGRVAQNPVVLSNYTYLRGSLGNSNVGYSAGATNAIVKNNFWIAGNVALRLINLSPNSIVTGNFFAGPLDPPDAPTRWPSNTYRASRPTSGQSVFVRPNAYEPGRATITVYNWGKATGVAVDLAAAALNLGDTFEIRDAEDFFGAPVAIGTYTGSPVTISMTGLTGVPPVGTVLRLPTHTAPEFGTFVIRKTNGSDGDTTAPTVTITAPSSGQVLAGTTALSANASDDVGVAGVQFQVDGVNVGAENGTAPFSTVWDTTQVSNGSHVIMAVARDAAGHRTSSTAVPITVSNGGFDTTTPVFILVEAESATLNWPMEEHTSGSASGGRYVSTSIWNAGSARFTVNLPVDGTYVIWARVIGNDSSHDSFFVESDDQDRDVYDVAEGVWANGWQWTVVNGRGGGSPATISPRLFTLPAGPHSFTFAGREPDTKLDQIILTNDLNFRPSGLP
jgi:Big-like domain-containing protein/parallel beta helix pectate lyase-like protein